MVLVESYSYLSGWLVSIAALLRQVLLSFPSCPAARGVMGESTHNHVYGQEDSFALSVLAGSPANGDCTPVMLVHEGAEYQGVNFNRLYFVKVLLQQQSVHSS